MSEAALKRHAAPGWFGKLPNLGDFASRRLPHRFIRSWDDWLQHSLLNAREELGDRWLALYLVAPIRRFWLAPAVLGRAAWAGVLMPSVDAVGRHFPLTIAVPIHDASKGLANVLAARDWFHAIDAVARQVLDVHFTVEDLEGSLAAVGAEPFDAPGDTSTGSLAGALLQPFEGAEPKRNVPATVWWCEDAELEPQFMRFASLPPAASFAALLAREVPGDDA